MNKVNVNLKDSQKKKLIKGYKDENNVKIKLSNEQIGGPDTIILDDENMKKVEEMQIKGGGKMITIKYTDLKEMKTGGFLNFILPAIAGLAGSLIGGSGVKCEHINVNCPEIKGDGLFLRMGNGLYLKTDNKSGGSNIYDISDEKTYGSGFLSAIVKILPQIAKKVLPALGIGALTGVASEGASQVVKKIAGRKGNGLYLGLKSGKGVHLYDLTDTTEGSGLLGKLFKAPGGKIPILGDIPLIGALF